MILDDYEPIGDEYVRKVPVLLHRDIERYIETSIPLFFNKIGYKVKKVPRKETRTVDYENEDLGIEVTSIGTYLPRNDEMDSLLNRLNQVNSRICAYMYLKDDKPKIEILNERQLENNISILCLRQHISCYRPKLINKINNKHSQDDDHSVHIIILDFRLAHFDPLSLKREIASILKKVGMDYPSLGGILASTPKQLNSDMLDYDSDHVFINNHHCKSQHDILTKLGSYSMATTSMWITVAPIFIRKPSNVQKISFSSIDCPDRDEIQRLGLPTFTDYSDILT